MSKSFCSPVDATSYCRALTALAVVIALALPAPAYASDRPGYTNQQRSGANNVLNNIDSGQVVTYAPDSVEGIGMAPGVTDVRLAIPGFNRYIDHAPTGSKNFIGFGNSTDLDSFLNSDEARNHYYLDFVRDADTVSVDYSAGVSDPALLVAGQTITRNVSTPIGRFDTRNNSAFDGARNLRFNDVVLNMERNDCRAPRDYRTGLPVAGAPATICSMKSWTERPTLILTYKATLSNGAVDPDRATAAASAASMSNSILSHEWIASWEKDLMNVPAITYPDDATGCGSLAHNEHSWRTTSSNNTATRTGADAAAAPNSCTNGVDSAILHWDTQREVVCYEGNMYDLDNYRDTNYSWSDVNCAATNVNCGSGMARTDNNNCVSVGGSRTYPMTGVGEHFSPFVGGPVQGVEGSALRACAAGGAWILHDFSGNYGGRKKPGKGCGDADSDHRNYVFNGNKSSSSSVLNMANYTVNWGQGSDTNCIGWMSAALCSGANWLVPSVEMRAQNVTDASQATPPADMPACPGDLNIIGGNPYSNTNYFATATTGVTPNGSNQIRTASSFDAGAYPTTVLAKEQLNCYQRTQYDAPWYNYDAPPEEWTTNTYCDYFGCYTDSTPPIGGYTTYYSLSILRTALNCREQVITEPTGTTVDNCNGTGLQGTQYRTYTASQGNVCGQNSGESFSCVPNEPNYPGGGGGGGGGCFTPDTLITMADGSKKPVLELKAGDKVKGETQVNTITGVVALTKTEALYGFNGGKAFVTGGHPFKTKNGWKAIDPSLTPEGKHNVTVTKLEIGDELILETGDTLTIKSIDKAEQAKAHQVFNPMMDGDHTYFSGGFLVHNKMRDTFDMNAN